MSDKTKKTVNIVMIILVILLLVFFVVFFFFLRGTPKPPAPQGGTGFPSFPTSTPPSVPRGEVQPPPQISYPTTTTPSIPQIGPFKPILRQISATPVAGGIIFKKDERQIVRYVDRAKGFIYETDAEKIEPVKVTINTIPKVYEAYFKNDGSAVILRYLKDDGDQITTFYGKIERKSGSVESELNGNFLPSNIKNLAVSPSGNKIFYISAVGGAEGILANIDGTSRFQIFDSPLSHWLPLWPRENLVMVVSKPSGFDFGSAYFIDAVSGKMKSVVDDIRGLTTLPNPSGELLLYSKTSGNDFTLNVRDLKNNSDKIILFKTLPEKCVWSVKNVNIVYCAVPNRITPALYPDEWYQGVVSFSDEIWKIDVNTGSGEFIMNLTDTSKTQFDAIDLKINTEENFIHFINKENLSYWSLQIAPQ